MGLLVSLSEIKEYLGIPLDDVTRDQFLNEQISLISEAIEGYCGRAFLSATYVQTIYKDEYESKIVPDIYLFQYPLVSIASVVEGVATITDYRLQKDMSLIRKPFGWFGYGDTIVVTYTAGYPALPAVIKYVLQSVISQNYNKLISGVNLSFGTDVQRVSIPGTISIDYDYTLQNNERKTPYGSILGQFVNLLDPYRSERAVYGTIKEIYVS